MRLNVDHLLIQALQEDITSEDVSTCSVMRTAQLGEVELICKENGIIAGLQIFERTFKLLDEDVDVHFFAHDGDEVHKGETYEYRAAKNGWYFIMTGTKAGGWVSGEYVKEV